MTSTFIQTPFADEPRRAQFEAVRAVLAADADGPPTLLLGNLRAADATIAFDAVVLRPHSLTVLLLVPQQGRLNIPALGYGSWLLNGQPLRGAGEFDNPFEQFSGQKPVLAAWLQGRLSAEDANLHFITGVVVFGGPLQFGPEVEAQLNGAASTNGFQLLANVAQLPRRLRQLATPEIDLSEADLNRLLADLQAEAPAEIKANQYVNKGKAAVEDEEGEADEIAEEFSGRTAETVPTDSSNYLGQKARQLWGWLGAADIPDEDPAYGYDPAAAAARGEEEKSRLEEVRQQLQAELSGQLQAMQEREAEREHSIAQLRHELARAPAIAPEAAALQARLAAENQEKAALEAAIQTSREEAAARNQALDAKIDQLTQLIGQLSAAPPVRPEPAPRPPSTALDGLPEAAESVPASPPPSQLPASPTERMSTPAPASATPAVAAAAPPAARPAWRAQAEAARHYLAARWTRLPKPAFEQVRTWPQRHPRRLAGAAAGLLVLLLSGWGLHHFNQAPPVPTQQNGRYGYADAGGQLLIPARYDAAQPFQPDGRAVVAQNGAYGFIDEKGQEIVAPTYDALNPYVGGYARARVGEAYTFLDEKGEEFSSYYFNALDFSEGYAAVLDHRGWHYITGPEEPAAPRIFREAYAFHDGLARVRLPDGYTFISKKFLTDSSADTKPFGRYELAEDFIDGRAQVRQGGRTFYIDRDGQEVK